MADLYHTNGTIEKIGPADGRYFTLEELYKLTACSTVQAVPLPDGTSIWMDEEGKYSSQLPNPKATAAFGKFLLPGDYLMGPVLHTAASESDDGESDD